MPLGCAPLELEEEEEEEAEKEEEKAVWRFTDGAVEEPFRRSAAVVALRTGCSGAAHSRNSSCAFK